MAAQLAQVWLSGTSKHLSQGQKESLSLGNEGVPLFGNTPCEEGLGLEFQGGRLQAPRGPLLGAAPLLSDSLLKPSHHLATQ